MTGAYRSSLIAQFLTEAILIASIGGVIALAAVWLCLPAFNNLLGSKVALDFTSPMLWISFAFFILITGILAGSYPAFYLSSFQPVKVLKGTFRRINATYSVRRLLVSIQFTIAISLVICTVIVQKQLEYARNRENGYDRDNLIYVHEEGAIPKNTTLIRKELLSSGVAASVTRLSSPLTESWSSSWGFGWKGKNDNDKIVFDMISADDQFVKTAGLQLLQGRDFDLTQYPTDSLGIILNESAVKAMKFNDPLGQIIQQNGRDWHVIGVIKDFILASPFEKTPPMVIMGAYGWFNVMHIKFNPALSTEDALKRAEAIFKRYNAEYPFEYTFVDEAYSKKFKETRRQGILAGAFTIVTIFVSCLGLFALAAYMAEKRKKEIGVRKVLGASVFSITGLLSMEFTLLVLVSCLVAFPLSYWFTDHFFLQMYS
ncbi:ABC transporter permease [Sphingobacterium thalpophilum]|uniref:ABC transporter permease n=1 Tax=Sphingobacterium thalpophilum TaxID=259 RepID=UPI003DA4DBB4